MQSILHIIDSLERGGAETLLMSYLPLLENYRNVIVICHGPNDFEELSENFTVYNLNKTLPIDFLGILILLRSIIKKEHIDIVHSHSYWTNIIARFASPKFVPLINHYHFADYHSMYESRSVKRMICLDRIVPHNKLSRVAVSEYVKSILEEKFPSKEVKIIPNFGTYTSAEFQDRSIRKPKESLKIIAVGSIKKEKNYALVIKAFELLQEYPIYIDIYGGGQQLLEYQEMSAHLPNVTFKGKSNRIEVLMKDYDLYCSASYSETFGIALMEAVSLGMPIIASNIPAFVEVAPEKIVMFENKDVNDFVKKIIDIFEKGIVVDVNSYKEKLSYYSKDQFLFKLNQLYKSIV